VLPLDDRTIELFGTRFRDRSPHPESRRYTYFPPMTPLPAQVAPAIGGRSWDLRATVERVSGTGGVIYASGTENSGLSLFVQDDHLVFDYNCFGDHHVVVSDQTLPEGESVLGVRFRRAGKGAEATLEIDGRDAGSLEIPFAMFIMSSIGPSVGFDHGSPVSDRYDGPFGFEGDLRRVDVALVSRADSSTAEATERHSMSQQ
jgi:arylsulfatase